MLWAESASSCHFLPPHFLPCFILFFPVSTFPSLPTYLLCCLSIRSSAFPSQIVSLPIFSCSSQPPPFLHILVFSPTSSCLFQPPFLHYFLVFFLLHSILVPFFSLHLCLLSLCLLLSFSSFYSRFRCPSFLPYLSVSFPTSSFLSIPTNYSSTSTYSLLVPFIHSSDFPSQTPYVSMSLPAPFLLYLLVSFPTSVCPLLPHSFLH